MKLLFKLLGIGALMFSNVVFAQQPVVIKFSYVNSNESPKGRAALHFKKLAEERTGGKVKVELYPNSVLYKDKEEMEALQMGAVQMLAPTLGKFGPMGAREFELFDLPYIFANYDEVHRVTQGAIGKQMLASLESKGLKGLAFWDNGFKQMNANKPLRAPKDFKGLKMRIFSSKVLDTQFRALGANPQVLAASEMYSALQTGLVDGSENPESNFYQFQFQEVQKYITMTNHGYIGYGVVVNKKFWDSLPADIRTTLDGAMATTTAYANSIAKKENEDALVAIRKTGKTEVITITQQERDELRKVMMKAHRENEDRIGKSLLHAVYRETGFTPDKL
jgi:C4-dicarboxylate-binding protein DctP